MATKKTKIFMVKSLLFCGMFLAMEVWLGGGVAVAQGAEINAASCEQADVQAAIDLAQSGDTILVPAGTCVWNSQLLVSKGLNLIGSGSDSTLIASTYIAPTTNSTDSRTCLLYYNANIEDDPANVKFRISGFTFDLANSSGAFFLRNSSVMPVKNFRISHNIFKNTVGYRTIYNFGQIWGLIDNNIFDNIGSAMGIYGSNSTSWSNLTFYFGTADNMYVEDNTFINLQNCPHSGGAGGRYAVRYNTYIMDSRGLYPWFDSHGNQGVGGNYSGMGLEVYGNKLVHTYPTAGVGMVDQRGGKGIVFSNLVFAKAGVSAKVREEYLDSLNLPAFGPDGQPQHVSDSYFWNNRKNNTQLVNFSVGQDTIDRTMVLNDPLILIENKTHWQQRTIEFDGKVDEIGSCGYYGGASCVKSGIGCGKISDRPSTCIEGVAYWATEQSCLDLTGMVGANPATPISGTLYKCISENTWEKYYEPYTYPHPLRIEDTTALPGDLNSDGVVNIFDYNIFLQNFGATDCGNIADLNSDCNVNIFDYNILLENFGTTGQS